MRQTPLKPGRKQELPKAERELATAWRKATVGKPCAVCGRRLGVEAHHVVYKWLIVSIAQTGGFDPAIWKWDKRNGLPLCNICHGRHHSGSARVPRLLIVEKTPLVFVFARELGSLATAQLKREYPTGAPTKG